jgi:hypothetical protein
MKMKNVYWSRVVLIYCIALILLPITIVAANLSEGNIANSNLSETCEVVFSPDLPLLASNAQIETDINAILTKYEDVFLGTSAPSTTSLSNAVSQYDNLNISVVNNEISGDIVASYTSVPFLRTFAQHLRFNPGDNGIREKANNTVWLVSQQVCDGTLAINGTLYDFEQFARPAALLCRHFDDKVRSLFTNALYMHNVFEHFWEPVYDQEYQALYETISTDVMYNTGDVLMAYAANQITEDERYLWMRGYKRWLERFTNYTFGTCNGIKVDGTGFHHWTAYDNYMYAFKTACDVIYYVTGTEFQIGAENYLVFRDAIYAQIVFSNDDGNKPLAMSGRKPYSRDVSYGSDHVKRLALAGGQILGLSTADPVLAGEFNRIWGISSDFNYRTVAPFSQSAGYFQFNYANMGVFRKSNWLAVTKGFTDGLWGAELYATSNRYGRYQSYGTMEIIYDGSLEIGNGYNVDTWNWNYNPGATTIALPWEMLHGEYARIDEYQQKSFAGALAFQNKNSATLNKTHGTVGMFAMDFQEEEGQGFSTYYGPNGHNATFRFKKSTFAFDDMIVCLGSNINNNDVANPTVTTLFQRLDNSGVDLWVNGLSQRRTATFDGVNNNWVFSNYKTGFYMVAGNNDTEVWNGFQQTPNHDQIEPTAYTGNLSEKYWIGYINHGTNPVDAGYEYMVIPQATTTLMTDLDNAIQAGNKPYTVHQKDANAHVLEHNSGVWGYALFAENTSFENNGILTAVSHPCLVMYRENAASSTLELAIANPDMGFTARTYEASVEKQIIVSIKGRWTLMDGDASKVGVFYTGQDTELHFTTNDGLPLEVELKLDIANQVHPMNQENIVLYPNPSSKLVYLEGDLPENSTWMITDSAGATLDEGRIDSAMPVIDVSGFLSGTYLLNVVYNNNVLYSEKFIVDKSH